MSRVAAVPRGRADRTAAAHAAADPRAFVGYHSPTPATNTGTPRLDVSQHLKAVCERGVFRPLEPVRLQGHQMENLWQSK